MGDYLSTKLVVESIANMSAVLQKVSADGPYHQRLEGARLSGLFVLLLRWDEMRSYAKAHQIVWPVSEQKGQVLEDFARVYR